MEKYSVLMSVYRAEKAEYISESVESMICQTVQPDEIVLVEDGPLTKELYREIQQLKERHPDLIKSVILKENGGLGKALNAGIKKCKNELIARMDTDDIAFPTRCEKQLKKFSEDHSLSIVGTQIVEFIDSINNIVPSRVVPTEIDQIRKFAKRRSPFNHPTVMYKKSVVEKYHGYREFGRKEDLDLFLRMIFDGCKATNLDEVLLYYRTSVANQKRRKTWINCKEYIQIMYGFFKIKEISFSDLSYVILGQVAMYLLPLNISDILSKRLLRKNKGNEMGE